MASKQAHKRLMKEHADLNKCPPPFIIARPKESDILEWHYIIRGPPDTPYAGGEFWGTVIFPSEYPFKPPGIKMITPSGRFQPDRKICTSMSDYHPGSWNPAWSVATILTGLLSFMVGEEMTTGSVRSSDGDRRIFAKRSHAYNVSQVKFRTIFPEYSNPNIVVDLPNMGAPKSDSLPAPVISAKTDEDTIENKKASTAKPAGGPIAERASQAMAKVQKGQSQLANNKPVLKATLAAFGLWMILSWWVS
ncbi:ubiquitin-conjugating enzyme E2 J2 [Phakopsora pachyrhizi]|uniref:Ubiquitin-conjugating enzyme E2 6 n=1 Tax=Phakopsora pachyrhizi TaxID=170000 RepID=A0AAV0BNB4_PHAPC|nr:ubiquitin-conjugating enzyme E2 J2 [Phakopsora pachyrhizi]CAH7687863.1 ubiquitin-conjugating enzyme E2 J2 [Phakopsora pachyrhizi]